MIYHVHVQGIVTNLDESSSQAQNTQGQATSAQMPETTEEATILSWSTNFLEEMLENANVRMGN
jgi:hypothetical protein